MAVKTVGAGKQYSTIPDAIAAAQDGDTIQADAGTYANQYAQITKNITLEGVGGTVKMTSTGLIPNGKGILVIDGNVTIDNFEFSGAKVADQNGAGIRFQSGNLTLNNTGFFDNEDGILTNNPGTGSVTINNSEFGNNGYDSPSGQAHGLYVGRIGSLTINNSYFHDVKYGHEIKSRADNTTITNSRIYDLNSTASYSIDLPEGGNVTINGNVIQQGLNSPNNTIISYGEEGHLNPGTNFVISNNTIINDVSGNAIGVRNTTANTAQITNNNFYGLTSTQIASGENVQFGNEFLATRPTLDTSPISGGTTSQPPTTEPPPPTTEPPTDTPLSIILVSDTGNSASDGITSNPAIKGTGQANTLVTIQEGSTTLGTTTADGTGAWSFMPPGLLAGPHTLSAFQTDLAGNTGSATLSFMLDSTLAPTALYGTEGNDVLTGTIVGHNVIYGLGGNDMISVSYSSTTTELYGGDGDDIIDGSLWGADYIDGGLGNDNLYGNWGNDTILGGDGNDRINAGAGDDILYTGSGTDYVQADYGNDTIYCGPGTNQIDGGPGTNTAIFAGNYADYGRTFANGVTTITGIEGTSSLANIETIKFNDGSYNVLTGLFQT